MPWSLLISILIPLLVALIKWLIGLPIGGMTPEQRKAVAKVANLMDQVRAHCIMQSMPWQGVEVQQAFAVQEEQAIFWRWEVWSIPNGGAGLTKSGDYETLPEAIVEMGKLEAAGNTGVQLRMVR